MHPKEQRAAGRHDHEPYRWGERHIRHAQLLLSPRCHASGRQLVRTPSHWRRVFTSAPLLLVCPATVWLLALPIAEGLGVPLVVVPLLPPSHLILPEHPPGLMSP